MPKFINLLVFIFFLSSVGYAQSQAKNLNLDENIDAWYNLLIEAENSIAQQGTYFPIKGQTSTNHQFYQSMDWAKGTLHIDGFKHENIDLLYNTFEDIILVKNLGQYPWLYKALKPNPKLITAFSVYAKDFINLPDSVAGHQFYEVLFNHPKIKLLSKRKKEKMIRSGQYEYQNKDQLWLIYDGKMTKINHKKQFYQLFPAHKKSLKNFMRSSLDYYESKTEIGILKIVKYCANNFINS